MTTQQNFDVTKFLAIIITILFLAVFISLNIGCNVQKKIEEAKKEAVRADRAEHPCANDTLYKLVPGETLILTDTIHRETTDTFFNWTYDTAFITKTLKRIDTIKAFIRDDYKINSLNDTINVHKQNESRLEGQLIQAKVNSLETEKASKNRLYIIIALSALILVGLGMYFKSFKL